MSSRTFNMEQVNDLKVYKRNKKQLGINKAIKFEALKVARPNRSKFIGVRFGEWTVIGSRVQNSYKRPYGKSKKATSHASLNYLLANSKGQTIELSGNSIRLMANGSRTIEAIIGSNKKGKVRKLLEVTNG